VEDHTKSQVILYLDTSALIKAYVEESHSDTVISAIAKADTVATHTISYVETHAAFARLYREQILTLDQFERVKRDFVEDWEAYFQIPFTQSLMLRSVEIAEICALRAYDSVHLAAADILFQQNQQVVIFASFDQRLNQAASQLGLQLMSYK
jgi:predicted nucleic acid-binding protein